MGINLLWSGLTGLLALPAVLNIIGLHPKEGVIEAVGGCFMVLGCILLWLKK